MSTIVIRDAELEDWAAWSEMVQDYDEDIGLQADAAWDRIHREGQGLACLVITEDDRPIGFMHWLLHDFFFKSGPVCYLSDLYVRPEHRNRGLGKAMLDYLFAEAARLKWSRVYWVTHRDNEDAQRLYDQYAGSFEFVRYHVDMPCQSLSAPSPMLTLGL